MDLDEREIEDEMRYARGRRGDRPVAPTRAWPARRLRVARAPDVVPAAASDA